MFTKMEGASHLQKSNVIIHWFFGGELGVYDDAFNGEGLFSWLFMAQVMFSSSNIQRRCNISIKEEVVESIDFVEPEYCCNG